MAVERRDLHGSSYLRTAVELLRHIRSVHPTFGVWEAADLEWWWRKQRSTDDAAQSFWFRDDRPIAAAILTDWGGRLGLDVIVEPDADRRFVDEVVEVGVERGRSLGRGPLECMVDKSDTAMGTRLTEAGFRQAPGTGTSAWMAASGHPSPSHLADGYRLADRGELLDRPHHFSDRVGLDVEARLGATSMYRRDLDLAVLDSSGDVVADGLFWFDPVTSVGFVEPIGTHEAHRRRGLARHLLTTGLDRLVDAGASRLKINWENDNAASSRLYEEVGFVPELTSVIYVEYTG